MWRQLCGIQHLTFRFFSRLQGHFCLRGILRGGLCGEEVLELLLSVSSFWRIPCVPVCWLGRPRVPVLRWLTFWRTLSVFLKCILSNSGNGRFRLHACTSSGCGRASCPAGSLKRVTAGTAVLPNEGIRRRSVRVLATHVQFRGVVHMDQVVSITARCDLFPRWKRCSQ